MIRLKRYISAAKGFRYPLIIPIVYYEGARAWTADMHLKERIEFSDEVDQYIPDFTYQVVSVNQYTNEELSTKHDEMSLVMLINKIQSAGDFAEFRKVSEDVVDSIYGNAPDEIREIYRKILWALLMKLRVPNDEAKEIMDGIGGQSMGFLFENMEKMDIQAERRNTAREKQRADDAELRAETAESQANEQKLRADDAESRANEQKLRADNAESRADSLADEVQRLRAELEALKSR